MNSRAVFLAVVAFATGVLAGILLPRPTRHADCITKAGCEPVGITLLARERQDGGWHASLPGSEPARPDGSPAALHRRQRVVLRRGGQKGVYRSRQAGRPRRVIGRLLPSSRG